MSSDIAALAVMRRRNAIRLEVATNLWFQVEEDAMSVSITGVDIHVTGHESVSLTS